MVRNYPGSKKINGLSHKILNHIPEHKIYYELFAGSGAIADMLPDTAKKILVDRSRSVTDNLRRVFGKRAKVINGKAIDIIKLLLRRIRSHTDIFVFMDPPYHHSTRPNNTELYEFEMTDRDHIQLLLAALQLKCNVMIIHPKCDLYDTLLREWNKITVKVRYHDKTSVECLYMNFPPPTSLQTDKHLGKDCWDRQRIKRKAKRFVSKLAVLPVLERKYIMRELIKNFN